jgi:chemotaxis methyl-accepting protein methylase/PAS domain-containing protein
MTTSKSNSKSKAKPKPSAKKPDKEEQPETQATPADEKIFPIVGMGASAGGLEALEHFLSHVPDQSNLGFVIVQHLDPTRKGILTELLQRATKMKVTQVRDRTKVLPNHVYVIPPNKDMSILHGVLYLMEPVSPRNQRMPIDFFLRTLAQDLEEKSIGVILSGMGSDGTLGLGAIKDKVGLTLAQEPTTAKFDSMPRSAIESGMADIVAPVDELPARILNYLQRAPKRLNAPEEPEEKHQGALEKIVILLRTQTGHDFSLYKKNTFHRRIERRMGIHQIDQITAYIRYLQENSQELDLLFKELLIGVTNFFRDEDPWVELKKTVLPNLLSNKTDGSVLRAWVPGCSTGEEAYSLAIVFKEALAAMKPSRQFTLNIFATDLDKDAIDRARRGEYLENIAAHVSPGRLKQYFVKTEQGYRVGTEIRECVVFATQSLIQDPPFTKLDLLSCRNLLIYFSPELQKKIIPLFHYSLRDGGILMLGSAETVGGYTHLFASTGSKTRIYRREEGTAKAELIDFPKSFSSTLPNGKEISQKLMQSPSLQSIADKLILDQYAPPTVLVNTEGNILYISGKTGKYLEPAAGKANWNIFVMAREGIRYELTTALQRIKVEPGLVELNGLRITEDDREYFVNVILRRLEDPETLRGLVMVAFTDAPKTMKQNKLNSKAGAPGRSKIHEARLVEIEDKYRRLCMELNNTREEMQTSQEELRSSNEEMQSTNEELQSTNEELTTSKEEMQSLNEELQTVNAELQARVDELSRSNNDMKNLLNSTDIATLFLDNDLHVRRFTTEATKLIKLISGDVGRPITDLASDLLYPDLAGDAREVLAKLGFVEKPIPSLDGRWFTVRIMPYRTLDDRIDGVVITFTDITKAKQLEAELREQREVLAKQIKDRDSNE